jgi:hypothetical protein
VWPHRSIKQPGIEPGSVPWQGTILPLDHCLVLGWQRDSELRMLLRRVRCRSARLCHNRSMAGICVISNGPRPTPARARAPTAARRRRRRRPASEGGGLQAAGPQQPLRGRCTPAGPLPPSCLLMGATPDDQGTSWDACMKDIPCMMHERTTRLCRLALGQPQHWCDPAAVVNCLEAGPLLPHSSGLQSAEYCTI